jgi:hypothetical protein
MGELEPAPISLRGRWAAEKPGVATADPNPATGPLHHLSALTVASRRTLRLPLGAAPTGLAYDAASDRFLITTDRGVYLANGALDRVEKHTIVDTLFSVDLARLVAGAFLDSRTVIAVGDNKSFVILKESDGTRTDAADRNFRYFLESFDDFDEVTRSRFTTVRARLMYVMSAAFDPATNSIIIVTVPNKTSKRMVVSRFDRADLTLAEEFVPTFADGVPFAPAQGAPGLERFYVTAATIADGNLYALSAAHSTLLTINLASHRVTAAQIVPGLDRPTGLAIRNDHFYILTDAGVLVIVRRD